MSQRERVAIPLHCPKCGMRGVATWEQNKPEHREVGVKSTLEDVSAGFYRRMEKTQRGTYEIICDRCGTAQPG